MRTVALIDYGSGNLPSAEKALWAAARTLDTPFDIRATSDPAFVAGADSIVLPGVGAFRACMSALTARDGLVQFALEVPRERARELEPLRQAAEAAASGVAGVLSATVDAGQKGQFAEKNTVRLVERFQWPLALGLWCLFVSFCYEFPVRPRTRDLKLATKSPSPASPKAKLTATAAALILLSALRAPPSVLAAAEPAAEPPPLARIVSRLSGQDTQSARDWAEFARETVIWGSHIQSESRPVPPGPVRDALAAVELGAAVDPKATDWPKVREELEALLKTPDDKKPDQQKNQQNQQDQSQDQKDQKDQKPDPSRQNQQKHDQPKQDSSSPQKSPQDKSSQPQNPPQNQPPKSDPGQPPESAFGDMKEPPKSPPPSRDTQKVGGTPEKKDAEQKPADPQLALPLQKLDQLRNQDSPAQLFQLMDADKKSVPKKKGKDW